MLELKIVDLIFIFFYFFIYFLIFGLRVRITITSYVKVTYTSQITVTSYITMSHIEEWKSFRIIMSYNMFTTC